MIVYILKVKYICIYKHIALHIDPFEPFAQFTKRRL